MTAKVPSVNSNGFLDLDKQVNCKNASYCTFDVVGPWVECSKKKKKSQAGNLPKFTFSTLWGLFSLNGELITMY